MISYLSYFACHLLATFEAKEIPEDSQKCAREKKDIESNKSLTRGFFVAIMKLADVQWEKCYEVTNQLANNSLELLASSMCIL